MKTVYTATHGELPVYKWINSHAHKRSRS